ncbi:chemotaxis protein CheD [uncultured Clostridium sp.]|uniref:chemotaxis protein CheD n=1 Tax=uncultured Clostridium sp. TaxID=59620 RepID=UPI002621EB96|nr:chemotaxis protein CheD [uncultured Clostridium sp.]
MTIGLGSCVGIALYDRGKNITGLIHIMLPDSECFSNKSNPYKFADTAIPLVLDEMVKRGALRFRIKAKIAGGAQMFKSQDYKFSNDIGNRNIAAVEKVLSECRITIDGKDVGGNKGRTMLVDSSTGMVVIKSMGKNVLEF